MYVYGQEFVDYHHRDDIGGWPHPQLPRLGRFWRSTGGIIYLGDSLYGKASPAGANLLGSIPDIEIESNYTLRTHDYNSDSWQNMSTSTIRNPTGGGNNPSTKNSKDRLERESQALIFASRFLDDHIIATYGWRKDTINSFQELAPLSDTKWALLDDSDFRVLDTSAGAEFSNTTFSYGVVGHVPNSFIENLPVDSLSFHISKAEKQRG